VRGADEARNESEETNLKRDSDEGDEDDPDEDAEESQANFSRIESVVLKDDRVGEEQAGRAKRR
jgi:hypothetical protein